MPRRSPATASRPRRILAGMLCLAILPLAALALQPAAPASALPASADASSPTYPTWADVQAAQADQAAAQKAVDSIKGLLTQLQATAASTQATADALGTTYQTAQQAYDEQAYTTQQLQTQAQDAQTQADAAKKSADQLIAQLSKTGGGGDMTANLLTHASSASNLLYQLGTMDKLTQRSNAVYAQALQLQQSAQSLTDQAKVAQTVLDQKRVAAQTAFQAAQTAAAAAQTAYADQQTHAAQLQAQLTVLTQKRQATQADYQAGIVAQWGANAGGQISSTGWARPASGYITSPYGYRYDPIWGNWSLHPGADIAGAGCGGTIYAAHAGTVAYAGPYGGYGNYVLIDDGDGVSTAYGHIVNGGIHVSVGEHVAPGQPIALVGSTGHSTGCHLHFEIRVNGNTTDPIPYLRTNGISIS